MANKNLFRSIVGRMLPAPDTINEAGGTAYAFDARHALAQYAATGCLNSTFYAGAGEQLDKVLQLCGEVDPEFIARTAIYARTEGHMKDMPALLCAVLSVRDGELLTRIFDRVIDNPRMVRNFVQILRSGAVGRKSLGSRPKRLVQRWLTTRTDEQLFYGSVGRDPSLADVIKMVHPKPASAQREALYGYLIGRSVDVDTLPEAVAQYERFKDPGTRGNTPLPDVPMQMLTSLELKRRHWLGIARQAPWQATRMNLNTFQRHGVFEVAGAADQIAAKLCDPRLVERSRVLPYQLMVAYTMASPELPAVIREALQDAMEHALRNVPSVDGKVVVLPDVSGSMHSPVTGIRKGSTTAVRCVDVAALVAAAMVRRNPGAQVIPFHDRVEPADLNPRDSVMTNATKLASLPSGGTSCSAPLRYLNEHKAAADVVVFVSDNESWIDSNRPWGGNQATETMRQWSVFKARNPQAKLVCIDIQPYGTTQARERADIVNVGGFSDQVFGLIADVARGGTDAGHWVRQIEAMEI